MLADGSSSTDGGPIHTTKPASVYARKNLGRVVHAARLRHMSTPIEMISRLNCLQYLANQAQLLDSIAPTCSPLALIIL
jgi:hypothetical protein